MKNFSLNHLKIFNFMEKINFCWIFSFYGSKSFISNDYRMNYIVKVIGKDLCKNRYDGQRTYRDMRK